MFGRRLHGHNIWIRFLQAIWNETQRYHGNILAREVDFYDDFLAHNGRTLIHRKIRQSTTSARRTGSFRQHHRPKTLWVIFDETVFVTFFLFIFSFILHISINRTFALFFVFHCRQMILLDASGSMSGKSFELAITTVNAILDTLSENDFVNLIAFSDKTRSVVPCFKDKMVIFSNKWRMISLDLFDTVNIIDDSRLFRCMIL